MSSVSSEYKRRRIDDSPSPSSSEAAPLNSESSLQKKVHTFADGVIFTGFWNRSLKSGEFTFPQQISSNQEWVSDSYAPRHLNSPNINAAVVTNFPFTGLQTEIDAKIVKLANETSGLSPKKM